MSGQGNSRGRRRNWNPAISTTQKVAARRRRAPGELYVAQTGDLTAAAKLLAAAGEAVGVIAGGLDAPGACWIAASMGDATAGVVGIVGVETIVDAAVIRSLAVTEAMRRRGIGAALVSAARKAAHTRGARRLYALGRRGEEYLLRFGFERVAAADMIDDLAGTFTADYLRVHPNELARMDPLRLDISRDGIIER
jgi:N-acetylglutamate synthase-like GNAT family acetyltransferase